MTPELNRVGIFRLTNVSPESHPSGDEHVLLMSTLQMVTNIMAGIYHKSIIICDAENWNGAIVGLLMSNFGRFISMLTVMILTYIAYL